MTVGYWFTAPVALTEFTLLAYIHTHVISPTGINFMRSCDLFQLPPSFSVWCFSSSNLSLLSKPGPSPHAENPDDGLVFLSQIFPTPRTPPTDTHPHLPLRLCLSLHWHPWPSARPLVVHARLGPRMSPASARPHLWIPCLFSFLSNFLIKFLGDFSVFKKILKNCIHFVKLVSVGDLVCHC